MYITQCRLCNSVLSSEPLLKLPDTPLANNFLSELVYQESFPLQLVSCNNCHHYQLNYNVPPEKLFRQYSFVSGTSPQNVAYFKEYAAYIVKRFNLQKGDLVLEIASNDGTLLQAFKDLGMKVLGVDPAINIANEATRKGIETISEFFTKELAEEIVKVYGYPKFCIANNVLAHLAGVVDMVKGIKKLLERGAIFSFENSYFKDVYVKNLFDIIYSEHESYPLAYPMSFLFKEHGMTMFDAIETSPHGGSIRGFVKNGNEVMSENLERMIRVERELGLLSSPEKNIKMQGFSKKIAELKKNLNDILSRYKSEGKKIAAYGTPAKFTTLAYTLGLNKETIDFAIEDNRLKANRFTPGLNIPIIHSSKFKEDINSVDVIILTAWNFAHSIMQNYKDFRGVWVIPIPEIKQLQYVKDNKRRKIVLKEINGKV